MKEIEIKAKLRNRKSVEQKLADLGCTLAEPVTQNDRVFLKKGIDYDHIKPDTAFLRIREEEDKVIFTFKVRDTNELDCFEEELEISDGQALARILEQMGFYEAVRIDKKRQRGRFKDYEVCLDEVEGLGSFIEIEKKSDEPAAKVQQEFTEIFAGLGVDKNDIVILGYDTLLHNKNKA